MVLKSYAKINFTLSVNKRLKSGLHSINQFIVLLTLNDRIILKKQK